MAKKKYPASQEKVSEKIAIVKREDPSLTNEQAAGKAIGILRHRAKKRKLGGHKG